MIANFGHLLLLSLACLHFMANILFTITLHPVSIALCVINNHPCETQCTENNYMNWTKLRCKEFALMIFGNPVSPKNEKSKPTFPPYSVPPWHPTEKTLESVIAKTCDDRSQEYLALLIFKSYCLTQTFLPVKLQATWPSHLTYLLLANFSCVKRS